MMSEEGVGVDFDSAEGCCLFDLLMEEHHGVPERFPNQPAELVLGRFSFKNLPNKYQKIPIAEFRCCFLLGPYAIAMHTEEDFYAAAGTHVFVFSFLKQGNVCHQERGHDLHECFEAFVAHIKRHEPQIPPFPCKSPLKMFRCNTQHNMMLDNLRTEQEHQHCKTKRLLMDGMEALGMERPNKFLKRHPRLLA